MAGWVAVVVGGGVELSAREGWYRPASLSFSVRSVFAYSPLPALWHCSINQCVCPCFQSGACAVGTNLGLADADTVKNSAAAAVSAAAENQTSLRRRKIRCCWRHDDDFSPCYLRRRRCCCCCCQHWRSIWCATTLKRSYGDGVNLVHRSNTVFLFHWIQASFFARVGRLVRFSWLIARFLIYFKLTVMDSLKLLDNCDAC